VPTPLFIHCQFEQIYTETSELVSIKYDINIVDRGTGSFSSQKYSNMDLLMTISMLLDIDGKDRRKRGKE
jgi:hypothetical protein